MDLPGITLIIPCFNHGQFVGEAVRSCLAQEGVDVRVIVVDDGSTDGSTPGACDRCASDRVRIVHQSNTGLSGARNAGAALAATEFIAFLDADDYLDPTFGRKLIAALRADPAASHAYCQETLTELGTGTWRVPEWDPLLLLITNLHPVTCVIRRDIFASSGGFDTSMNLGYEDWEYWVRLSSRGFHGVRVPEPLFFWRRHSHTTMVMEAVKRHDLLYRQIIERHPALFASRSVDIIALANTMLRKFDANWIDETGFPIPLQWLWSQRDEAARLRVEREELTRQAGALASQVTALNAELAQTRGWYEQLLAVRLYRWVRRRIDGLPAPLAGAARSTLGAGKKLIPTEPHHARPTRGAARV
jgi:glycosyltransferase involved in cell wall biosynthesis